MNRRSSKNNNHIEMIDMGVKANRYSKNTIDNSWYLDSRGLEVTPNTMKSSWVKINNLFVHPEHLDFNTSLKNENPTERISDKELEYRKKAILYIYVYVLGCPPPDVWGGSTGTLTDIINRLSLPKNSRTRIKEMLEAQYKFEENNEVTEKESGRPRLIEERTDEAAIIISSLERGVGMGNATVLVNEFRRGKGLNPVSYRAVQRYATSSKFLVCSKRRTKKSGKDDKGTIWAKARVAQCKQWIEEIANRSLSIYGLVFWDEKHKKCILGCCQKHEWRVSRDDEGQVCEVERGGKFPDTMPVTSVKFPQEARGIFGAAVVQRADGTLEGVKAAPYDYTGKNVVGPTKFEKMIKAECARVMPMKGIWSGGQGYQGKYKDNWREHVIKKIHSDGYICIIDLMKHVISESNKIYENTDQFLTFKIFHDGLTAWWEKEAQDYMESRGFKHRQIMNTNEENKATRYNNKVVGDSPEICRALDSHGFAHLERSIKLQVAITSIYNITDRRRFKLGTPAEVFDTLKRCWTIAPTSEQIIEDIMGFPEILEKIIEAEGCVIPDEYLRTGRRARSSSGAILKKNPSKRQRIATNIDIILHDDSIAASEMMSSTSAEIFDITDESDDDDDKLSEVLESDSEN